MWRPAINVALLLLGAAELVRAQGGSPDPAFAAIPLERWIAEGNPAHIRWSAKVLPVELSNYQRLEAKVELQIDGNELVPRRGQGYLGMLVQFSDSENHVYQTHEALDLQRVTEDAAKSNVSYVQPAFVTPGDYRISVAILDTATGEHSAVRLPLHVNPIKNDPLPDSWQGLPAVEFLKHAESPGDLFLPNIVGRLHVPLETRRPIHVQVLVNASPVSAGEPSRSEQVQNRSLVSVIPALKVITNTEIRNGTLEATLLDLTTQQVIFQQDDVHDLDWPKVALALKQAGPNVIDVAALKKRREAAQFFVSQVRKRVEPGEPRAAGEPLPILIVLSGPMAFESGEDLRPIDVEGAPPAEVFYMRFHSLPLRPRIDPVQEELARRRGRIAERSPGLAASSEPVDSLERTLKPLQPHLFDIYTPEQFRKALRNVLDEVARSQ